MIRTSCIQRSTYANVQALVAWGIILTSTTLACNDDVGYSPTDEPNNNIDRNENSICIINGIINPSSEESSSPLALALNLSVPLAIDTEGAEFEQSSFWEDNGSLLQDAWKEWEENLSGDSSHDGPIINTPLSMALDDAFDNPSENTESAVKSLWMNSNYSKENRTPLPKGVYAMQQLLTPSGISHIRNLLDTATSSGIPTRRPNGMNRHGVIIDQSVHGAVSMKSLVTLVEEEVINRIVRPVGRMLFPDRVGCSDDVEYFAFTIRYDGAAAHDTSLSNTIDGNAINEDDSIRPKCDFELKEHRDASIVTLNINLNLPEEGYTGSEIYFREFPSENESTRTSESTSNHPQGLTSPEGNNYSKDDGGGTIRFAPGMAIIHLGAHRHGAMPISASMRGKNVSGKRYNLVIWLFGKDGDVRIAPYADMDRMNVHDRWHGCNHTQGLHNFG